MPPVRRHGYIHEKPPNATFQYSFAHKSGCPMNPQAKFQIALRPSDVHFFAGVVFCTASNFVRLSRASISLGLDP